MTEMPGQGRIKNLIEFTSVGVDVATQRDGHTARNRILGTINLTLSEHRVAFIGANGSGKSTILRLINGLMVPTSGTIRVNGVDPAARGREVRSHVGLVFTDPLQQIIMSTPAEDIGLSLRKRVPAGAERRARALEYLSGFGIEHVADRSIYDLSSGERQLVALAAVLAVEPRIVLADEPTTLLDLRYQTRLGRFLVELPQQLIVATHDLVLAAATDRVILIDGGAILADGEPAEVIGYYRKMMES